MQYMREHLPRAAEEVEKLVNDYFASTKAGENMPPLEFKWNLYETQDKHGSLLFITARGEEKKELCGFVLYHILPHLHHRTVLALCDILAVHPDYRGKGVGSELVSYGEQFARAQGVTQIVHGFRLDYTQDIAPLFPKLGYTPKETWYVKDLR